jgi:DNA-binding transcriptional LysR family regulator
VDWFPSIEASSVDLVETYVAGNLGIGVSVAIPEKKPLENVRVLPLPDFPPVVLGALWHGKMTPLLETLLQELRVRAERLAQPSSPTDFKK